MARATDKITALYCRLSVEDTKEKGGKDDPSNSIQHQQIMLMEYAKSQHFPNPTFFIDDGYSGVEFSNRPGFQKMLAEIEAGHVEAVITKDLSRLGRNSSLTGLYINYTFPQYGVRYIAINDHFDTIDPNSTDSDMAGIKNWFNEWYSKDTSRKIRAVNKAKGERGERLTTNVPYGYKHDSGDPKKWVIDEEAAQVVKQIFALCMEGKGPSQIAALLEKELCVYDLTQALGMTQSAVSHQLRLLRNAHLVKTRREGKSIFYSLDDDHVVTIMSQGLAHIRHTGR